jgi:hypothetical protein
MVEISLSGSGEGPGASKRPGLLYSRVVVARERVPKLRSPRVWADLLSVRSGWTSGPM